MLDKTAPGSIILFHNAALHTPEALPDIISALQEEGYSLVKVEDLICHGAYTIDHTGRQCPAEQEEGRKKSETAGI